MASSAMANLGKRRLQSLPLSDPEEGPQSRPPLEEYILEVDRPSDAQKLLWNRVQDGTGTASLRQTAAKVAKATQTSSAKPKDLIRALQRYVQKKVLYLREHPETYVHPARTLEWGAGDCDDQAALLASLLRSVKIPARLTFCYWSTGPSRRGHVWTEAWIPYPAGYGQKGRWVPAETIRSVPLGWDPIAAIKRQATSGLQIFSIGDPPGRIAEP